MAKITKIFGAFLHAPERFDDLAGRIADVSWNLDERTAGLNRRFEETGELLDGVHRRIDADAVRMDSMQGQIDVNHLQIVQAESRSDELKVRIGNAEKRIDEKDIRWFMDQICDDRELLSRLNRGLSIAPTVWGDPERLEIDETASVFTCFFNTNSGRIRVGESTFAGSGVSLLAGSHDPQLKGFMRRDVATNEGCDIEVGRGVWLASGCTLLGPCSVGDNAVIAAGAVVTPGTRVPANTVWGGVPARQIGTIEDKPMTPDNPAVRRAFENSGGMLFADGWGERIPGIFETPGHWMHKKAANLITDRPEWKLEYRNEGNGESRICLAGPAGEEEILIPAGEGETAVRLPVTGDGPEEVRLTRETEGKIFMAWSLPDAPAAEEPAEKVRDEAPAETAAAEAEGSGEEKLDIEKIMVEIREEAQRWEPSGDLPAFDGLTEREAAYLTEDGTLDIAKIMEEIRAEARKLGPCDDLPAFGSMSKEDTRKCEKLKEQVRQLTEHYEIPVSYQDPSRNPLKRLYKKCTTKAVRCATAPMSVRMTETNLALKTALEKAVEVIEEQEKRIAELERRLP